MAALAALGFELARRRLAPREGRAITPVTLAALAIPLCWTSFDYFVRWAPSDAAFRATMEDKAQGAELVRSWVNAGERVFLAPLYAQDFTYRYLTRDLPVDSFDIGATVVLPAGQPARYAFPPDDRDGLTTTADRLASFPLPATFALAADATGRRALLATLRRDALPAPAPPSDLRRFEDGIALAGAELSPAAGRPGAPVSLVLDWIAERPPIRGYSVFVHVRDASGATRFQRDRAPGFPTDRWRAGDRVLDYHRLELPANLPAGDYQLVVGLYLVSSGQRLVVASDPTRPNELLVARLRVERS